MKLSGGTLFYALAISVIIALVTSGIIVSEFCNRMLLQDDAVREEVVRNAESGIIYYCAQENAPGELDLDLFGRGKDSVLLQGKTWGAYDLCVATAHTGRHTARRIAMTGGLCNVPENNFALWLADMDRPLAVTGATHLRGTCLLPKSGVERAYIEGKTFSGRQLVEGTIKLSSRFIPEYNKQRVEELENVFRISDSDTDSLVEWSAVSSSATITQSFSGKTLLITSEFPMDIANISLSGQIRCVSAVSIRVKNTAVLKDVVLAAPRIYIEHDVHGTFQSFARDSILVGEDVELNYPSVLAICPSRFSIVDPSIVLGEGSAVEGELFLVNSDKKPQQKGSILIQRETKIEGSVYCSGFIDLKGTVSGSVTCQKFILKTNSAVYENHLMDAVIDYTARDENWLSSALVYRSIPQHVISWLQ